MKTIHITIQVQEGKEPPRFVNRIEDILINAFFEQVDNGDVDIEILVEE